METTFFWNSAGFPIPYKQETDATTITSLLPDKREEVVLKRNFSISFGMRQSNSFFGTFYLSIIKWKGGAFIGKIST